MDYRKAAWELAQNGQIDEAITAWTLAQRNGDTSAVLRENLELAQAWLSGTPKDGFLRKDGDTRLLDHLLHLQKEIGNQDDLDIAIQAALNEWRISPNSNLYDWTLNQIRSGVGSPAKILVLSAIGEYLEQSVEKACSAQLVLPSAKNGTTLRSKC
ncbi:hypothetical protein HF670_03945 [Acidithiobacillus thiooxidans]|uniref:Uncharacterized protein n=1 Tax=Acidithiobacillus thiooxidans TaxID=930 RepID=A0A1C2JL90_ACITH|nr:MULTISPECIES: hypothetical protein [Acidithiobacillus]MBU2743581.1 hypothetical protein [Acidithiobacillus albertensis]MBU2792428.1 hypothetical protein [Acidithiobacillus thiooxidans]MBU2838727.1 hypothetical protein [Acidithiobacillus thiooxidans]MBU2843213.1 hypothetical protein [Acidithiobacillus thiooxidans]OCX73555.1 hypothetical protein A6P07_08415 [Acidithiobacillus thiooxidans]